MKKSSLIFVFLIIYLSSFGQTITGKISCEVVSSPLAIQNISKMEFGSIEKRLLEQQIIIMPILVNPSLDQIITGFNNRSEIRATIVESAKTGQQQSYPSIFVVAGAPNVNYEINLPSKVIIYQVDGSEAMTVDHFTSIPSQKGTLDQNGRSAISVGATLNVGQLQTSGVYNSQEFEIKINYN